MINRTIAPLPAGNVSFSIPKITLLKSANGIDVHYIKKDKLPIVQIIVMFSSGSKFDPELKKGLSFLTSLMIDEGAAEYDSLQLNNEFEKLGSVINISTDQDIFSFSLMSIKENFYRSFELLSKIINQPRFEEKDFLREKNKMLDRILQLKDEPSYIATTVFEKLVFEDTFYSFPEIGFENTVKSISLENVIEFYKKTLLQSEIKLIAVGNIDEKEILELTEKFLPVNYNLIREPKFVKPERTKTKFYIVDKKDSAQTEIRVGQISKTRKAEDYYAARLMNAILGGQFSSRINLNLREHKGFTYGANSAFNYLKSAAYFDVATAVNIQNTGEAILEILKELNEIRVDIRQNEINFTKSYLIKQFPSQFETYNQYARNIVPLIVNSLDIDYYQNYSTNLASTTEDEIFKAAIENIYPDELIVLAVGDKKIIEPQLKTICNGNIFEADITGKLLN